MIGEECSDSGVAESVLNPDGCGVGEETDSLQLDSWSISASGSVEDVESPSVDMNCEDG